MSKGNVQLVKFIFFVDIANIKLNPFLPAPEIQDALIPIVN